MVVEGEKEKVRMMTSEKMVVMRRIKGAEKVVREMLVGVVGGVVDWWLCILVGEIGSDVAGYGWKSLKSFILLQGGHVRLGIL